MVEPRPPFSEFIPRLRNAYEALRDPVRAPAMVAYMRGQFPFLGIPGPVAKVQLREAAAGLAKPTQAELESVAQELWALPEREYQYAACFVLAKHGAVCDASFLETARELILTKSWWDTVDTLATNVVGPLVRRHPELAAVMDEWITSDNTWLARTAILHQLKFKSATHRGRLFGYCEIRSADTEFFIRKAIGWALREYSKTDAEAVRRFVAEHDVELSGLSKREALLWLNGGRKKPA